MEPTTRIRWQGCLNLVILILFIITLVMIVERW
jgi:hypothetical protein